MELFNIRAKQVIQLCFANWKDVCAIQGLVTRDNPARYIVLGNSDCGEHPEDGLYLQVLVPITISASMLPQIASHGDYLVVLENNKVLVVPCPEDVEVQHELLEEGNEVSIGADFEFARRDFPLYSRWMHKNGNTYIITGYRNEPEPGEKCRPGYPVKIDYANVDTGKPYGRVAHDWHRSMTRIG